MIDLELRNPGAALIGNGRNEAMHFAVELQVFSDISPHRLQSASVIVGFNLRRPRDKEVGNHGRQTSTEKGILPVGAPTTHKIVAFFQFPKQSGDILWIILRVTVHENDDVTLTVRKTRRDGGRLTKIALEPHDTKTRFPTLAKRQDVKFCSA